MIHMFVLLFSCPENNITQELNYFFFISADEPELPSGWRVQEEDRVWLAKALFRKDPNKLTSSVWKQDADQFWHLPPQPVPRPSEPPKADRYFAKPLFLWMPKKMWAVDLRCTVEGCQGHLRSMGIYKRVKLIFRVQDTYYMATENLICSGK